MEWSFLLSFASLWFSDFWVLFLSVESVILFWSPFFSLGMCCRFWKLLSHWTCLGAYLMVLGNQSIMVPLFCLRLTWIYLVSYCSEWLYMLFYSLVICISFNQSLCLFQEVLSTLVREPILRRWYRQGFLQLMWWIPLLEGKRFHFSLLLVFPTMK